MRGKSLRRGDRMCVMSAYAARASDATMKRRTARWAGEQAWSPALIPAKAEPQKTIVIVAGMATEMERFGDMRRIVGCHPANAKWQRGSSLPLLSGGTRVREDPFADRVKEPGSKFWLQRGVLGRTTGLRILIEVISLREEPGGEVMVAAPL